MSFLRLAVLKRQSSGSVRLHILRFSRVQKRVECGRTELHLHVRSIVLLHFPLFSRDAELLFYGLKV